MTGRWTSAAMLAALCACSAPPDAAQAERAEGQGPAGVGTESKPATNDSSHGLAWGNHMRLDFSNAVLGGEGCSGLARDLAIGGAYDGADVAGVLGRLDLSGAGPMAARVQCTVRVPVEIEAGYRVASVNLRVVYDAVKTYGASLSIGANAWIADATSPAEARADMPEGTYVWTAGSVAGAYASYDVPNSCAQRRPQRGFLAVNVAMSARRFNTQETVRAAIRELRLREGVEIDVQRCP